MSNDLKVWIEPKRHSVEGHTAQCTLSFNGCIIWGPRHCHDNTIRLRDALAAADPRFQLTVVSKRKTIEGHTYAISVMAGDRLYLDRMSTHGHMLGLCNAINDCLAAERKRGPRVCGSCSSIYLKPSFLTSSPRVHPTQHQHQHRHGQNSPTRFPKSNNKHSLLHLLDNQGNQNGQERSDR